MVKLKPPIGDAMPLHCTAVGKAYLAFEAEEKSAGSLPDTLSRYTEHTVTDRATLSAQLEGVVKAGFAFDCGEYLDEVCSVAVPIRDYTRSLVGMLALAGPVYRMDGERIKTEIAPRILEAGRELSQRLGYNE